MAFRIEIFTRNMELTDRIREYINKKVSKLDRFLSDIDETKVDLTYNKTARNSRDRQVAQITIRGRGFILRTEERADDIYAAFDKAIDKMQRQIERYKGKHYHNRRNGRTTMDVAEAIPDEEDSKTGAALIVRRKTFDIVPMSEVEALEQMNLLGHDNFFIFYNADTNAISVLYRRRDGTYGLIEPKVA